MPPSEAIRAKNRRGAAAHRARLRALTPFEILAGRGAYTAEEQALADLIRHQTAELRRLAEDLHGKVTARLEAEPQFPDRDAVLAGIRDGFTRIQLPNH